MAEAKVLPANFTKPETFILESLEHEDEKESRLDGKILHDVLKLHGKKPLYYRQQREKGSSYQVAVRALAFKWIRILYQCWKTQTPYDESKYLNALRKRDRRSSKTSH